MAAEKEPAKACMEVEPQPNFTGYWRLVKTENFDEYMKVLGLPWVVRKVATKFSSGATDLIWQKGKQMRVTTVNAKGAWTRMHTEGKSVYQRNAAGEPVRIKTWWEGRVHKTRAVGSSFGTLESWRFMEGSLMAVKSRCVAPDGREGSCYWTFEAMPVPHRRAAAGASEAAVLKQVWKDQSLVEKATRKDNLHLQVLLHNLSRWDTPADRFIQLLASPNEEAKSAGRQRARGRSAHSTTATGDALSDCASAPDLAATESSHAPMTGRGTHRRVLSDPASVLSNDTPSALSGDLSEAHTEPPPACGSPANEPATSVPAAGSGAGGDVGAAPLVLREGLNRSTAATAGTSAGDGGGGSEGSGARSPATCGGGNVAAAAAGAGPDSRTLSECDVASGEASGSPPGDSPALGSAVGVESPRSGKSAGARSGRSVASGTIRATPRGTPCASLDQNDLEKVLAWKLHEFKDIRGIASVVPVKNPHATAEPELLQMSPEQAEQTHVKLQELEEQSRLDRQQMDHSVSCFCCMVSLREFMVPDYLKSWEY